MHPSPILAVTLAAHEPHHRRFRLELGGRQPEATFTHRDEELFRLRHSRVSDTQDGLVSLINHSVHFAGNVEWDLHTSHVPIRIRTSFVSGDVLVQCGLGVRSQ